MGRQVHQYDKIFRENLDETSPGLIKNLLGIDTHQTEELPDDIQHTKERQSDVLKKVIDRSGDTFVLQVEFQVRNEQEMPFRMAEYYIMLLRKYKLPVRQYVIYVGNGKLAMKDHIHSGSMHFKYQLITLSSVSYHLFLRFDNPKEKMLAVLANFGKEDPDSALKTIADQIIQTSSGDFAKRRHINQLRILAQLRNFKLQNLYNMDSLKGVFSNEKDILYQIGEIEGRDKGMKEATQKTKAALVKSLLLNTDFSMTKIASLVDVSVYAVRKIRKTLH